MRRSWSERVEEYVGSPRLSRRIRIGNEVFSRVIGDYGTYRCRTNLRRMVDSSCTCPYEGFPCKHVVALRKTYRLKPKSFVSGDAILKRLAGKDKGQLLELVRETIRQDKTLLELLGVRGFVEDDEEDEESE